MAYVNDGESRSDGVVLIRPLAVGDAEVHHAGEDDEIVRWLTGGRSTVPSNRVFIADSLELWRNDGPQFVFGVRRADNDELTGTIDVRTVEPYLLAGQVNIAYAVYPRWRGRGIATRAVRLMVEFLRARPGAREAVIRVDPDNLRSVGVARAAGFTLTHRTDDEHGRLDWYVRALKSF
jgi:RimJ/RimL family protein N-acetyltransferase